ncbi:hypothetical protein [Chroococcidiopsis sp. SAG 2025]|nr:hypothetical protein [Chroococcidiopsis sp. SAG 2025]
MCSKPRSHPPLIEIEEMILLSAFSSCLPSTLDRGDRLIADCL